MIVFLLLAIRSDATSLASIGYEDLQALREDAVVEDLQQAGLKLGHARRLLNALQALDIKKPTI